MSTGAGTSAWALRTSGRTGGPGFDAAGNIRFAALIVAAGAIVSYLFVSGPRPAALVLAFLPLGLWLLTQPLLLLVALAPPSRRS